jgi:trimeric autotransporter adhesin
MAGRLCSVAVLASLVLAASLGAVASSVGVESAASAQDVGGTTLPTTVSGRFVVAGYVNAMVRAGEAVYVGGEFSRIANRTGSALVVPSSGGHIEPVRAEIAGGPVEAAVADGDGGWYVGGSFTSVGDTQRDGLAHIDAEGSLDRVFASPDLGEVRALALAGEVLVVSAAKPKMPAVTRALSARTGAVLPLTYEPPRGAGASRFLLVSGSRLFIAYGNRRLAAYTVSSGIRLWQRHFCESCYAAPGGLETLAIDHERLIVGGGFKEGRNENLAVLDAGNGTLRRPSLRIPRPVLSVAVVRGTAYVAYRMYRPGSSGLAAVDLATGRIRSWGAVRPTVLAANGTTVFMAGVSVNVYSAQAGTAHAVLHRVSPPLAGDVFALVPQGRRLLLGGSFTGAGGAVRHNLAAFDARTGKLLRWRPDASDVGCCGVSALAAEGRTIYVGGPFKRVSGARRTGLAAVSADGRGRVLPWRPRLKSWDIDALAVGAGRVFAGGFLVFPGTTEDRNMAAFSAGGLGARRRFAPKLGSEFDVDVLTVWHRTLIVGGQNVIAYSADGDGRHQLWSRSTDLYVFAFATRGNTLYAGGNFEHVGRRPRERLAAFALNRRGALLDFAPAVPISVETMTLFGSDIVFGGGDYEHDSTQVLGAVNLDGTLEPWRFDATPESIEVTRIAPVNGGLFLAGHFDWLGPPGNQAAGGIAWLR